MNDIPGDPRFANDPIPSSERPEILRLNSETLDRTFDSGNMSIQGISVPHQNQSGDTSSLDTVTESPSNETKVKSKVSTYEQKIAQQSEKMASPEKKPSTSVQGSQSPEEPTKKPTRAALTRYQSHISQFKLAPSSTSSGISPKPQDDPAFTFPSGATVNVSTRASVPSQQQQQQPLTAAQLPALGMAPFSVSDSMDLQDSSPVRYVPTEQRAQPAVSYPASAQPAQAMMAPTPGPIFGIDPAGSFLQNPASALLLTAALNALTHAQAQSTQDPNNPLTNAITAASAQILAAALSQAHLQGHSQMPGMTVAAPGLPMNAGPVPMVQQAAYPSQAPMIPSWSPQSAPAPVQSARTGQYPSAASNSSHDNTHAPLPREGGVKMSPDGQPSARASPNAVLTPRPTSDSRIRAPSPSPAHIAASAVAGSNNSVPASPSNVPVPNGLRPKPITTSAETGLKSSLSSSPPGMVRTKSLTFSDAGSVSTFTPPTTYRDYLSKYSSGMEAINTVRRAGSEASPPMPPIGENGSYKYGGANGKEEHKGGEFSHSMDVLAGISPEKSKPKTLQRNPTILSELTVDEPPPQFSNHKGAGGTPAPTSSALTAATSNTVLSKKESRQMMDVLLEGTDSKNQRLKAEAEYQRATGHYSKLFHTCDPRVFEASFTNAGEHRETDAPSVGSGSHSQSPSRSPYRTTMAQLIANSPRFVKVQSMLTPAADSAHSGEAGDQKAPAREAEPIITAADEDEESVGHFGDGVVSLHDEYGLSLKDAPTDKLDLSGSDRPELFARGDSTGSSQLGNSVKNSPKKHATLPHRAGREAATEGTSGRAPGQSRKEAENMTASQFMNSSTRGVHTSFRFDHSNKRDIVGRQTNSIRGQGKLHTTALDFVQDQCLNSIDAKNLKAASIKNRNVLVGWQILILRKGELSLLGLAVITGVRTNMFLQTEYRISTDVTLDCWMRLKRQKGYGGTEFQPLRKVLTTKVTKTKLKILPPHHGQEPPQQRSLALQKLS